MNRIKSTSIEKKTVRHKKMKQFLSQWPMHLMVLPALVLIIVFHYIPIYGIQIAFKDYQPAVGIFESPWIGLEHFKKFCSSSYFFRTFTNTLRITVSSLIFSFPVPILFALLLNEVRQKKLKKFVQTVTFAPHFISTTVMVGMVLVFLSPTSGIINHFIKMIGFEPVNFMQESKWFVPVYVISGIWQGTGWSSILYLASLSGIDVSQYEAAKIDGASNWRIMWQINLPAIVPTIAIQFIMRCSSLLSLEFEKVYLMQNDLNMDVSEVISTYVYKVGLINAQYGFSTAVGLFNSIVCVILMVAANKISDKLSGTSFF